VRSLLRPGTDVMILEIIFAKKVGEKIAEFCSKHNGLFAKNVLIIVFLRKPIFS
jgi:hypothetical protein